MGPALAEREFDFIAQFAGKLPMDVISELVGVPIADRDRLRGLADAVMHREEDVFDVPPLRSMATVHEIISFLFLMVVAGNETTTKLLGNAIYWGWHEFR